MHNRENINVSSALKVFLSTADGDEPRACLAKNLSLCGAFVLTDSRWPVDSTLNVRVEKGEREAKTTARVTHVAGDGVGLVFVDPVAAFRFVISESIADRLSAGVPSDEQRTDMRFFSDLSITWRIGTLEQAGRLRDISRGGAFVCGPDTPIVGTVGYLYLPGFSEAGIPSGEIFGSSAKVMHVKPDGFGVHFEEPSEEFRNATEQWIAQLNST